MRKINLNKFFEIIDLERINNQNSNILKIINENHKNFLDIKEVYCSTIKKNDIRAWKKHTKMFCNILVIKGSIKFVFFDNSFSTSKEIIITEDNSKILFIKPNIWFGFKGLYENNSLINFSNIMHDESEVLRKKYNEEYTEF